MEHFRVWLHETPGEPCVAQNIEAASPRAAAEIAHGGPLAAFGPMSLHRVTVMATCGTRRIDSFFRKLIAA